MGREPAPLLSVRFRVALVVAGLLASGLLCLAAYLDPSPHGFGTHQQLGLGPCWIYETTGVRCPSCGMTTAWAYLAQGDLARAIQSHAGGALAAVVAIAATPWLWWAACLGRWPVIQPAGHWLLLGLTVWLAVVLVDWGTRLLFR